MTQLEINRDQLVEALTFRFEASDGGWYLDTETGDVLLEAEGVDSDELPADLKDSPRYLWVEPITSHESFSIMEDFVAGLNDPPLAERLQRALGGRKPFRQFKDALQELPPVREAWFQFEWAAHTRLAAEWCEANGIEVGWQ